MAHVEPAKDHIFTPVITYGVFDDLNGTILLSHFGYKGLINFASSLWYLGKQQIISYLHYVVHIYSMCITAYF